LDKIMNNIIVHTDGGARGNPGPAAIGVLIEAGDTDHIFAKISRKIGSTTNNVAEYSAVIAGLIWLKDQIRGNLKKTGPVSIYEPSTQDRDPYGIGNEPLGNFSRNLREIHINSTIENDKPDGLSQKRQTVRFFLDSTLVVNQLNGLFKVKESHLREFLLQVRQLESEIPADIYYQYIPREQNREADLLVNQALDG
jgi:ribonuclease HI